MHSSGNLSEEERRGREETRSVYAEVIQKKEKSEDKYNVPFTLRLDRYKTVPPGFRGPFLRLLRPKLPDVA